MVSGEIRNHRLSVLRSCRECHLLPVLCVLSLPPPLPHAQHCVHRGSFCSTASGSPVARGCTALLLPGWGACELGIVNVDGHMMKNGDGEVSVCSSCIPARGLLKSGWVLIKMCIREEEVVWEWSVGGICKSMCWILFILLLVIDGIY